LFNSISFYLTWSLTPDGERTGSAFLSVFVDSVTSVRVDVIQRCILPPHQQQQPHQ